MPFTFAHPALILPLLHRRRRWVSATGLVTGSIAPDFEKFIHFRLSSDYSHTWPSVFYFSLPMALVLGCCYHWVVRNPLVANLPLGWYQRLVPFCRFSWGAHLRAHGAGVVLSILIGAVSHLAWDRFTHAGAGYMRYLPLLRAHVPVGSAQVPLYALLATLSSVLGSLVVLLALYRLPRHSLEARPQLSRTPYWATLVGSTLGIVAVWGAVALPVRQFWDAPVAVLSCALLALVVTSVIQRRRYLPLPE